MAKNAVFIVYLNSLQGCFCQVVGDTIDYDFTFDWVSYIFIPDFDGALMQDYFSSAINYLHI